ncbi:hypothetical protein SLEP1_g51265 [Rubroshorea leprosula]|uniref:Uncharacterized protein n=1 Tax=Rubroshorea leprosula TaxID=152421 RepID=A0AAV5M2L9_9ROSI|nr:hypothetical protein SLEP1_g51265 [Rubroshorea leprosula]
MASFLTRHFPWFPRPQFHFLKWWTRKNYEINSVSKYEVPLIKLIACQQVQSRKTDTIRERNRRLLYRSRPASNTHWQAHCLLVYNPHKQGHCLLVYNPH